MPTKVVDTLPRTERFAKLDWPAAGMTLRLASALVTRSSCLLFHDLVDFEIVPVLTSGEFWANVQSAET